jgi:hypothetical protein
MTMNCSQELQNIGCAWRGLKEQLGEEIDNMIRGMTFLKGKMVHLSFIVLPVRRGRVIFVFTFEIKPPSFTLCTIIAILLRLCNLLA